MNAADQVRQEQLSGQAQQQQGTKEPVLPPEAPTTNPPAMAVATGQGAWKSEAVLSGLEKALNALFKAQDHLNTAADQGGEGLSKMIDGITRSLRGLQREVSQVIYRLDKGG